MANNFSSLPDITPLLKSLIVLAIVGWTFGMWKLVEIIIWLFNHVSITVGA